MEFNSGFKGLIYINSTFIPVVYRVIKNDCLGFNLALQMQTPCDFFLWGYVKDQVSVPPLPASIPELTVRIRTASETITADMLQTVWNELDYRVDVQKLECCSINLLKPTGHVMHQQV